MYDFMYYGSSVWYVFITMSSVGYGSIIASTPIGRTLGVFAALVGAFLLSLLVAIISDWFQLEDHK